MYKLSPQSIALFIRKCFYGSKRMKNKKKPP